MAEDALRTWKGRRVRAPGEGPEAAARKVPEALRPGSLFFVPSPLEGWGLETLLDRLPHPGVVVVFEKDEELDEAVAGAQSDWLGPRAQDPRLFRLAADTEEAVRHLFDLLPLEGLRRVEFLTLNGAWMAHASRYRQIFQRLEEGLTRWWSNRITCMTLGPLWTKNLLDNLAAQQGPWAPWPRWGKEPLVVVGAGVTAEAALPWVQAHRAQLRVVAADTALGILGAAGVEPDAIVCLEAQHANLRDFAGWVGRRPLLFGDLTMLPAQARILAGETRWFATEFAPLGLWGRWPWAEVPRLPPLGSVGTAAVRVALDLGSGPVVTAGLDFSFPPGRSHARQSPALAGLLAQTHRLRPADQGGTWARPGLRPSPSGWWTTPVMEGYAGGLADLVRAYPGRIFRWPGSGLDFGAELWDPHGPLGTSTVGGEASLGTPSGKPGRNEAQGQTPGAWLEGEAARWAVWEQRLTRALEAPGRDPRLVTDWAEVDYLTFSFPDPRPRDEADWVARARHQVRWALGRIGALRP